MDHSISVVLPVHNAEASLARQVADILEVLPDLTNRFELLIVDDGSTDQTEDSAQELAKRFPQLRVVRHAQRQGMSGVVRTSLAQAMGKVVFVQGPANPLTRHDVLQIQAAGSMTPKANPGFPKVFDKRMVWGSGVSSAMEA